MDFNTITDRVSEILKITPEDAIKFIQGSFSSEDPFKSLSDLLGLSNIDLVFEIFKSRELFANKDFKNAQGLFVEYVIPESSPTLHHHSLVPTSAVGSDSKHFSYSKFNPVQSAVFKDVYKSDGNVLISAPTGAGKTDIALLAILRALRVKDSTVIYIVPMKALATEVFLKLKRILVLYRVIEYTGDTEIDSRIASTARVVVCTPEKFDAATRRLSCVFSHVKLVVIDEIHLLEDDRGPVLEAIVARTFKRCETEQSATRIMGLSATLPNYKDVAEFIKAQHVHFFDKAFRPVPLRMTITGFTKASDYRSECDYLAEKVRFFLGKQKQVLVFVHSRSRTFKIALFLSQNTPVEQVTIPASSARLKGDLQSLASKSVGVHHAGLSREDRLIMEEMFRDGHLRVLVCTSTLAWGVNLPAYAVIISGSTFYDPSKGQFSDLGILDILQIFGRAGRPQYDSRGEAILMTTSDKMDMYVRLVKRSEDVESRMLFHVPENLNAEIYLGNVFSMSSALSWIRSTFLAVRMMKNPARYGVLPEEIGMEEQALSEYVCLTVKRLEDCGMVRIDRREANHNTWTFSSTFYGQIASLYYLNHLTMYSWLQEVQNVTDEVSLINLLLRSEEFKNITVRKDEVSCLSSIHQDLLLDSIVDFEFDESVQSKLLILLVSYLCYKKMPIFSLSCDVDYVVDNIKRLINAFKEILMYIGKYELFRIAFLLEKKICRFRKVKGSGLQAKLTRIDDEFVELSIGLDSPGGFTVFVFHGRNIEYVFDTPGECRHVFRYRHESMSVKIHTNREWTIFETILRAERDYSMFGLCRFGVHCCDVRFSLSGSRHDCAHFVAQERSPSNREGGSSTAVENLLRRTLRVSGGCSNGGNIEKNPSQTEETYNNIVSVDFSLNIEFVEVTSNNYRERLRIITRNISQANLESVLIVCSSMSDAKETHQYLNTKLALDNLDLSKGYGIGKSPKKDSVRWICTFGQAVDIRGFNNVIFKGVSDGKSLYSVYTIFRIANKRKAIIYDRRSNIEFMRSVASSTRIPGYAT